VQYALAFLSQNKPTTQLCQYSLIEEFFEPFHLEPYRRLASSRVAGRPGETTGFVELYRSLKKGHEWQILVKEATVARAVQV
jgi:hypothetical protein